MLRSQEADVSKLGCVYLEPPPRQVLQLMPAPRQVPHQMPVKARCLQHAQHDHARYPRSQPQEHPELPAHEPTTLKIQSPNAELLF